MKSQTEKSDSAEQPTAASDAVRQCLKEFYNQAQQYYKAEQTEEGQFERLISASLSSAYTNAYYLLKNALENR